MASKFCSVVCVCACVFKDLFYLTTYILTCKVQFLVFTVLKVVSFMENKMLRIKGAVKLGMQLASYTKKCQV